MGLYIRVGILSGILIGFGIYVSFFSAPSSFPNVALLEIQSGETSRDIAHSLKMNGEIRSELVFRVLMRLYGVDTHVPAGTYSFPQPANVFGIVWQLKTGNFSLKQVRITVPEGTNVRQMSELIHNAVAGFDSVAFLKQAQPQEGYLFPDTYFLYPGEKIDTILAAMQDNFKAHVEDPEAQRILVASKKPLSELIIMASLLEKEAPDTKNRQIISGILWKRLSKGMLLQVDAVFPYITGKNGKDILQKDYAIDSPYNTYLYKGLPPGPITNPGLDAILAAATPTTTSYLYYLSDKQGNFHYSATYAGQVANEAKYLK